MLGDFALQTRHADVKPCPEKVKVAGIAQVYFGIDGYVSGKRDFIFWHNAIALMNSGPTAANNCSGSCRFPELRSRELHIQAAIITVGTPPRDRPKYGLGVYRTVTLPGLNQMLR